MMSYPQIPEMRNKNCGLHINNTCPLNSVGACDKSSLHSYSEGSYWTENTSVLQSITIFGKNIIIIFGKVSSYLSDVLQRRETECWQVAGYRIPSTF